MARVRLDLPDHFEFETRLTLAISDINYGGHMGNDAVLRLAHEARLRFFKSHGWTEMNVAGAAIIMADAAIVYRAEAFHGDELIVRVTPADFGSSGCDLVYQFIRTTDQCEIARAKTGIVFFDYQTRKTCRVPALFRARFDCQNEKAPS